MVFRAAKNEEALPGEIFGHLASEPSHLTPAARRTLAAFFWSARSIRSVYVGESRVKYRFGLFSEQILSLIIVREPGWQAGMVRERLFNLPWTLDRLYSEFSDLYSGIAVLVIEPGSKTYRWTACGNGVVDLSLNGWRQFENNEPFFNRLNHVLSADAWCEPFEPILTPLGRYFAAHNGFINMSLVKPGNFGTEAVGVLNKNELADLRAAMLPLTIIDWMRAISIVPADARGPLLGLDWATRERSWQEDFNLIFNTLMKFLTDHAYSGLACLPCFGCEEPPQTPILGVIPSLVIGRADRPDNRVLSYAQWFLNNQEAALAHGLDVLFPLKVQSALVDALDTLLVDNRAISTAILSQKASQPESLLLSLGGTPGASPGDRLRFKRGLDEVVSQVNLLAPYNYLDWHFINQIGELPYKAEGLVIKGQARKIGDDQLFSLPPVLPAEVKKVLEKFLSRFFLDEALLTMPQDEEGWGLHLYLAASAYPGFAASLSETKIQLRRLNLPAPFKNIVVHRNEPRRTWPTEAEALRLVGKPLLESYRVFHQIARKPAPLKFPIEANHDAAWIAYTTHDLYYWSDQVPKKLKKKFLVDELPLIIQLLADLTK